MPPVVNAKVEGGVLRARPLSKRTIQLLAGTLKSRLNGLSALPVPAQVPQVVLGEMKVSQTPHPFRAPPLGCGLGDESVKE